MAQMAQMARVGMIAAPDLVARASQSAVTTQAALSVDLLRFCPLLELGCQPVHPAQAFGRALQISQMVLMTHLLMLVLLL